MATAARGARGGCGRARGLGARRRLRGAARLVARLRRARLVRRAARARLRVPLRPARELDPEHGRGEPCAAARLDLPQPARDRLRARRRVAPARRGTSEALDAARRRRDLRGPPLDAHARSLHRARRSASSCSPLCAARGARRRSRSGRSRSLPRSSRSSPRSGRRRRTRAPSSPASARTRRSRGRRRTIRSAPTRARPRVTCGRCATGSRPSLATPGATGSGTPVSRRREPGRSSRRASRPTRSSASTPGSPGWQRSSRGSWRSGSRCAAARRGSRRRSPPSPCSACRPT